MIIGHRISQKVLIFFDMMAHSKLIYFINLTHNCNVIINYIIKLKCESFKFFKKTSLEIRKYCTENVKLSNNTMCLRIFLIITLRL